MNLAEFECYGRSEVLKKYRYLRYVKENSSYFLYLIFSSNTCVYVGETSNIFWRMIKHKGKCTADAKVWLQECKDKEEVLKLEKHYIRFFKPKFNNRYCQQGQLELFEV